MEIVVIWFLFAIFSAVIASSKGRSGAWFFVGLFFGPFGLLVAVLPSLKRPPDPVAATRATYAEPRRETRSCPFCAEQILAAAVKCKHCGSSVEPLAAQVADTKSVTGADLPKLSRASSDVLAGRAVMKNGKVVRPLTRTQIAIIVFCCVFLILVFAKAASMLTHPAPTDPLAGMKTVSAFSQCQDKGIKYYKEIGSFPRLSDGRSAYDVIDQKCRVTSAAFS
jgi:hypothetical protein